MFTIKELTQLSNFLIEDFKSVFVTKQELRTVEDKIDKVQESVDGIAKLSEENKLEISALGDKVSTIEGWVEKVTLKVGVEYKP